MFIRYSKQKHYEPACYAVREFFGIEFFFKKSNREPQNDLVDAP